VQLHCSGISRVADDWGVVSVKALYGASAASYAEKPILFFHTLKTSHFKKSIRLTET